MGQHQRERGRATIEALSNLGDLLKYHARREWPIPGTGTHPQAIDVCWFFDDVQTSPLFAFEVESTDSAAAQGNANKLFAKPTEQLQKPLFFFHIFLDGPDSDTRKDDLVALYGKYNYSVYDLKNNSIQPLLLDILGQHRRLSDRLPVFRLCQYVDSNPDLPVDIGTLMQHVSSLGFERGRGTLLTELGLLTVNNVDVRDAVLAELTFRFGDSRQFEYEQYETWLGNYYQDAVHWGMLCHLDPMQQAHCVEQIINWQHGDGTRPLMIHPDFGQTQDYDHFVLCWSPSFWALLVGLVGDSPDFRRFVCDQIDRVCIAAENTNYSIYLPYTGLWMLKIAICDPALRKYTDRARQLIADNGGVPSESWLDPPAVVPLEAGTFPLGIAPDFLDSPRFDVTTTDDDLRSQLAAPDDNWRFPAMACAFDVLIDHQGLHGKGKRIAALLQDTYAGCLGQSLRCPSGSP